MLCSSVGSAMLPSIALNTRDVWSRTAGNRSFWDNPLGSERLRWEVELVYCFKCQASPHSLCLLVRAFTCGSVSWHFNAQLLQSLLLQYRPSCYWHEYERTDVTAGQPYVTSLLDLYALIISSLGTNIDILGLNVQTLQTASLHLALSVSWQHPRLPRKVQDNCSLLSSLPSAVVRWVL